MPLFSHTCSFASIFFFLIEVYKAVKCAILKRVTAQQALACTHTQVPAAQIEKIEYSQRPRGVPHDSFQSILAPTNRCCDSCHHTLVWSDFNVTKVGSAGCVFLLGPH